MTDHPAEPRPPKGEYGERVIYLAEGIIVDLFIPKPMTNWFQKQRIKWEPEYQTANRLFADYTAMAARCRELEQENQRLRAELDEASEDAATAADNAGWGYSR